MLIKKTSFMWLFTIFAAGIIFPSVSLCGQEWVAASDVHTQFLIDKLGKIAPESVGYIGGKGLDEMISQLSDEFDKKSLLILNDLLTEMETLLKSEKHPKVRQDLNILITFLQQNIEEINLIDRLLLPYTDPVELIFLGLNFLLSDQVTEPRRPAALVRLRRYTGLEPGWTSILTQAENRLRTSLKNQQLFGPFRGEVELDLQTAPSYIAGISALLDKYGLTGADEAVAVLKKQIETWESFVKKEVLPRSRDDHRLPPELYRLKLIQNGIDMPLEELVNRSQAAFREIQNEMHVIASLIAEKRGWQSHDYRHVIREFKKEQLEPGKAVARYRDRINYMTHIAKEKKIVTFPSRDLIIRLATEAESSSDPGPSMKMPPMINNTGEMGEFIIALGSGDGPKMDDFTHEAATWTLAAHEGRPGHELQITRALENGISKARVLFGLNTANVEGWALYIEAEMKPYLPLEGQLFSLQYRLLRAARAFLDPGIQMGDISPETVLSVLIDDVVISEPLAKQELERYTDRHPGQAPAYFFGYTRMMELRTEIERRLGKKFDQLKYHDFLMGLGPVPISLVRRSLLEDFIPLMLEQE
ncbi:MAG: DUF885 domain-containing protein [Candidatus Aminicenantes bacterium]|nr:DUF885 domain-containing protein [Candidatus Aminicenantes bacterium]